MDLSSCFEHTNKCITCSLRHDQNSSKVYSGIHQLGNHFLHKTCFPESGVLRFLTAPFASVEKFLSCSCALWLNIFSVIKFVWDISVFFFLISDLMDSKSVKL